MIITYVLLLKSTTEGVLQNVHCHIVACLPGVICAKNLRKPPVECGRGSNPCVKVTKLESVKVFEQCIKYFARIGDPETIVGAMVHQWFL